MKYLLLEHAFEQLGAERVEFKTDVLNEQARRGLRNIGAKAPTESACMKWGMGTSCGA